MVLSTANEGKWFSNKWRRDRQRALIDRTRFGSDDLDWLDIDSNEGTGAYREDTWRMRTTPLDPRTNSRKRCRRNTE